MRVCGQIRCASSAGQSTSTATSSSPLPPAENLAQRVGRENVNVAGADKRRLHSVDARPCGQQRRADTCSAARSPARAIALEKQNRLVADAFRLVELEATRRRPPACRRRRPFATNRAPRAPAPSPPAARRRPRRDRPPGTSARGAARRLPPQHGSGPPSTFGASRSGLSAAVSSCSIVASLALDRNGRRCRYGGQPQLVGVTLTGIAESAVAKSRKPRQRHARRPSPPRIAAPAAHAGAAGGFDRILPLNDGPIGDRRQRQPRVREARGARRGRRRRPTWASLPASGSAAGREAAKQGPTLRDRDPAGRSAVAASVRRRPPRGRRPRAASAATGGTARRPAPLALLAEHCWPSQGAASRCALSRCGGRSSSDVTRRRISGRDLTGRRIDCQRWCVDRDLAASLGFPQTLFSSLTWRRRPRRPTRRVVGAAWWPRHRRRTGTTLRPPRDRAHNRTATTIAAIFTVLIRRRRRRCHRRTRRGSLGLAPAVWRKSTFDSESRRRSPPHDRTAAQSPALPPRSASPAASQLTNSPLRPRPPPPWELQSKTSPPRPARSPPRPRSPHLRAMAATPAPCCRTSGTP